jgi:hypothetical protein
MKALWTALLVLTVCAAAIAIPPQPFFGLNLNANMPVEDFSGKDFINEEGGASTGIGGEIDVGLAWPDFAVYAGYMFAVNPAEGASDVVIPWPHSDSFHADASGDWTFRRVILGARIPLSQAKVSPVIGAGLSIGTAKFDPTVTIEGESFQLNEVSSTSTGMFFEGGVRVSIDPKAVMLALVQYHKYDATFDLDLPESMFGNQTVSSNFTVTYLALRLGVAYQF